MGGQGVFCQQTSDRVAGDPAIAHVLDGNYAKERTILVEQPVAQLIGDVQCECNYPMVHLGSSGCHQALPRIPPRAPGVVVKDSTQAFKKLPNGRKTLETQWGENTFSGLLRLYRTNEGIVVLLVKEQCTGGRDQERHHCT